MINKGMFTNNSNEWCTPRQLYDELNKQYHFDIDLASSDENHLCDHYFTKKNDALANEWGGHVAFCNPPYGKEIGKFVEKAYKTVMDNRYKTIIVMLIPSRTDTKYWHNYIFNCPYASIKFLKGRIKFVMDGEIQQSAPFPSAIVVFDNINKQKSKILY